MNFLKEVIEELDKYNLKLDDAKFIGSNEVQITIEQFKRLADFEYEIDYDNYEGIFADDLEIYVGDYIFYREEHSDVYWWENRYVGNLNPSFAQVDSDDLIKGKYGYSLKECLDNIAKEDIICSNCNKHIATTTGDLALCNNCLAEYIMKL